MRPFTILKAIILSLAFLPLLPYINLTRANALKPELDRNTASKSISLSWQLAQAQPTTQTQAEQLLDQGSEQYQARQFDAAIQSWQGALKLYQKQQDLPKEGLILGSLGLAYEGLGNYRQAVDYFQQSLSVVQKTGERSVEASILGNLGNNHLRLSNYAEALKSYEQSLAIWKTLGDRANQGQVLRGLGNVQIALGNYSKALDLHQQSLEIARSEGDLIGTTYSYNSLGAIHANQGNYQQASKFYQQSLSAAKEIGDGTISQTLQAQSLYNLGTVEHSQNNFAQALEYYQQSLELARTSKDIHLEGRASQGIGGAYTSLGNYSQALEYLEKGLVIAKQVGDRQLEATALHSLGGTLWKAGRAKEAEPRLRESLAILENMRSGLGDLDRVAIFETQRYTYALLKRILAEQNQYEAALEMSEAERTRAFVELLARRRSGNAQLPASLEQQATPPNIAEIRQIAQQQKATIVEYSAIADENFVAQGTLRGRYVKLYIWVVRPTGEVVFRSLDLAPQQADLIEKQLAGWSSSWQRSNIINALRSQGQEITNLALEERINKLSNQFEQIHRSLYQLLLEPIADLLPTNPDETVIFIPQAELFNVSFPALQDASGNYAIEKHAILTAPSIQVLKFTRQQREHLRNNPSTSTEALVIGNPTMPSTVSIPGKSPVTLKLRPLPGAEQEATAIAQILNTQPLIGANATEAAIKEQMSSARLIHFATHGLLDDFTGSGVPGAIALAPAGKDDGLLTSDEILNLRLNAELVIVSACDLGRGRLTRDGVVGLSRSLLASGVPTLALALWEVDDRSTAVLMNEFYQQLTQGQNKAQALRQAMLKTKQEYPDPTKWAAFTLIGEAD